MLSLFNLESLFESKKAKSIESDPFGFDPFGFWFAISLIATFFPFLAYSDCGTIPATYPQYSSSGINLSQSISVNGTNVNSGNNSPNTVININGAISNNVGLSLPDLDPSSLPSNSADDHNHISSSTTYYHTTDVYHHDIKASTAGITIDLTGGGPYHLNELKADQDNVTLNIAAGIYYLDKFKVGVDDDNITVNITSGPVIFHIGTEFKIEGKNVNINVGGNVDDFRVYLHNAATFTTTKSDFNMVGLIYGPSNVGAVTIGGDNSSIRGAIIIDGGPIELTKNGFTHTYTTADQTAIGNISTCQVLEDPILDYKFDACSLASAVEDSQGNYNGIATGTDSSDSTSVLGGRSLDLSGTSTSDWVTVPKSAVNGLTNFSLSVWIKTGTSSSLQSIFHALGSSTSDGELKLYLKYSNEVGIKIKGQLGTLSANKTLTDNTWHHLVITREDNSVCLYVDGNQTDCDSGLPTGTLSVSTTNSVVIGQEQDSFRSSPSLNSGFSSAQSFKGYIDELKIYNSAMSSSQAQTLYTTESSGSNTSSCVADLIASYNFDDDWVTNSSLTDQTGSYDGSPSGSVSQVSAGASGSKGDTCYAGSFNGGYIDITGLPVSTSTGARTSVSFWMYWDGTEVVIPMGWYLHYLLISSSYFGFGTANADVTGISPSNLATGWHHIAVVFTNGSVSGNKLYVDGVLKTITLIKGSVNTSRAVVQSTLRMGGDTYFSSNYFSGQLDNFKVYDGTITQTQVTTDMNESNACPSVYIPAVDFNCVENGSNGISGKLYTKTTSQSFSFDIVALQDSSTIETSFASSVDQTVTVELVDNSSGGSCSAYAVLSPAVSQSLTFTSANAGTKASALMTSGTAYSSVACRVTDANNSPSIVSCSTDKFSIRPTNFTVTSSLTNTGSTGSPVAKAGDSFTLTATATNGYNGTPSIDSSKLQAHSGAIQVGTLTGTFNAASSGVATGTSFVYSEVGSIRFATEGIYDSTFTSVDPSTECTNDFSNTVVSGKVGCKFGNTAASNYFGRFTPDHFDLLLTSPVFTSACSSFTYLGQPIKYATNPVVAVTAKNASGTITQNYTGDFWKISSASLTPTYSEATYALNVLESSAPTVTDNNNGTGLFTYADTSSNILALTKGALASPYDAEIALSFTLTDTDSITVANVGGSAQTNPVKFGAATSGNGISFSSNKAHRWGRVVLNNAHGSELNPLSVPVKTEYYTGSSFINNSSDSCTNFTLANDFSISDTADFDCSFTTQTSPVAVSSGSVKANLSSSTVSNGSNTLSLSSNTDTTKGPGAGNTGYVEITSKLASLSWLLYDWDADGSHDNCPSARATFGIYKGNSKIIYFREVY